MPFLDIGPIPPPRGVKPAPAVPSRATPPKLSARAGCLVAVALLLFVAVVASVIGFSLWWNTHTPGPGPGPSPGVDANFVAIGREYGPLLDSEWAAALRQGAKILDAGQPVATAIETVQKSWEANRQAGLARKVTPELSRIVGEGTDEKDITREQRARLAAAWRGLAAGAEEAK